MSNKLPEDLIGVPEAAAILRVSPQRVRSLLRRSEDSPARLRGWRMRGQATRILVSRAEVEALLVPVGAPPAGRREEERRAKEEEAELDRLLGRRG